MKCQKIIKRTINQKLNTKFIKQINKDGQKFSNGWNNSKLCKLNEKLKQTEQHK